MAFADMQGDYSHPKPIRGRKISAEVRCGRIIGLMQSRPSARNGLVDFLRRNRRFLLAGALVALAFRVFFLWKFRLLTDDSFVYGEIAKNWLQHRVFGQTYDQVAEPTFIRMPGYPLFLVLTWIIAGVEHYTAVLI